MMQPRKALFGFFICLAFATSAQKPKLIWDYGMNANFNVAFIRPIASDSFSNKAGFGGGLMLEASKGRYTMQLSPSFAQTGYINDNTLGITTMQAIDVSLDFIYATNRDTSFFVQAGFTPTFNFSHVEKNLDGTKTSGLKETSVSGAKTIALAYKLGFGFKLSDGVRMNANYLWFFDSEQTKGKITGRVDYLQFGIQLRFNEFNRGEEVVKKIQTETVASVASNEHSKALTSNATMVFVLPKFVARNNTTEAKAEGERVAQLQIESIYRYYKAGNFVVINPDQLNNMLAGYPIEAFNSDSEPNTITISKPFYVARIGEFFYEDNSRIRYGVRVYDAEMNNLIEPFPFAHLYAGMDTDFKDEKSLARMIFSLSTAIIQGK